jgi:hypothetical protein
MVETKFYLELSDEIEELLSDNQISIEDILQNENIDADVTYGILPYQVEEGARDKKIIHIIIASSVATLPISFAFSNILNTIYNKPYLVEINKFEVLKDENGKIILDKEGQPIFKPIKIYDLLQPRKEDISNELELKFQDKEGILIKVKTTEDQE